MFCLNACGNSNESAIPSPIPAIPASENQEVGMDSIKVSFTVTKLDDGSYVCTPSGQGPFPSVLYNHGGLGTAVGGDLRGTCMALAEEGFLARSEKRSETVPLAGHLDEVLDGLDTLRSHEKADRSRIGIMGFSRGGLLTLQAAIAQPRDVHAILIFAPAPGITTLQETLIDVSPILAPTSLYVSENDTFPANHVQLSRDVEDALRAAEKDVTLTLYPPFENNGHRLFFEIRDIYWDDVINFLQTSIGAQ